MPTARAYKTMDTSTMTTQQTATTTKPEKVTTNNNKRKRDSPEQNGNGRPRAVSGPGGSGNGNEVIDSLLLGDGADGFPGLREQLTHHTNNPNAMASSTTAAAALAARVPQMSGVTALPSLTVPQPTEMSFQTTAGDNDDGPVESSFDMGGNGGAGDPAHSHPEGSSYNVDSYNMNGATAGHLGPDTTATRPAVGSNEWSKQRRDSHKEVERRRRETINEGINELAKIVPGGEKNKGAILQRAVSYITRLKSNEKQNIEKWTLEKILTDQAIQELSRSVDELKKKLDSSEREVEVRIREEDGLRAELERMKWRCQEAGLKIDGEEASGGRPS